MTDLPLWFSIAFVLLTFFTVWMFYRATKNRLWLGLTLLIMALQAGLASAGFFLDSQAVPPRIAFLLVPNVLLIVLVFFTKQGKATLNRIDPVAYTYLHTVRVPVEFSILMLFLYGYMPESMSFEGRNFDILSGLTAPFIAYYGYTKGKLSNKTLMAWEVICLLLVLQVVVTGIFSAPSPVQQIEFEQPNNGILYFPFVWLPGIIVPMVIFGHIAAIRRLRKGMKL